MKFPLIIQIIFVLLLTSNSIFGQNAKFTYGVNFGIIQRANKLSIVENSNFEKTESSNRLGFNLGLSFYYKINNRAQLRLAPVVSFEEDRFDYSSNGTTDVLFYGPIFIKLPLHVIISINENSPVGILLGVTSGVQTGSAPEPPIDKMKIEKYNFTTDLGINYSFKMKSLQVIPEFRYSLSLVNSINDNRTEFGQAISSYKRNMFVFALYFKQ